VGHPRRADTLWDWYRPSGRKTVGVLAIFRLLLYSAWEVADILWRTVEVMKRRYILFWLFALLFAWFGRDVNRKPKR
jgi:hypothetical protein